MASIVYTATRTISSGHSASAVYTLDFDPQELLPSKKTMKDPSESLDGTVESILHYTGRVWLVRTDLIVQANLELWHEFFDSVINGETFTFDAHGTSGSPDNIQNVTMEVDGQISNVGPLHYDFSFSVKVL